MTTERLQTYLAAQEQQGPRIEAFARLRATQLHQSDQAKKMA
jgi:hypothetical protein